MKKDFKTEVTDMTLVDALVVAKGLPQDELEQIATFSGPGATDPQHLALQIANCNGPKFTVRVKETGEPLVVACFFQVGATIWRSCMLANQRAWDEFGFEVTMHARKVMKEIVKDQEHVRVETICLAKRLKACEWYPKIGLTYESTMHGYGINGESAVMYVSTKGARNS